LGCAVSKGGIGDQWRSPGDDEMEGEEEVKKRRKGRKR
jgi:hypothetical protein